jgi:hypothetical protein
MFKKNVLMGMLALAFVTLAAREVLAWDLLPGDPLYGCFDEFCSYEGDVFIIGAKGKSVDAGTTVSMLQLIEAGHILGFCINPQGKLNPSGAAFHKVAVTSVGPANPGDCLKNGKCPVDVHQPTTVLDLPADCTATSTPQCPAACDGRTGVECLGLLYGVDTTTACNNNWSFFGVVWDQVSLQFNVIDPLSANNPVATLNATCTSPDGLVFPQPSPFNCVVPKK